MTTSDNIREEHLKKLEKIRALGLNPYPANFDKKQSIAQTREMEGKNVKTAGKLFSFRTHGNIAFADLKDETGKIQLFFKKTELGEENYKNLNLLDIGDYVGVEGTVIKTIAGELSIAPTSYTLLSKSLLPLPNQWYGLKDVEARYRQRYLDLLLNPEVRERFNVRTKVIRELRHYLDNLGFWEVESPVLQPLYGGANAKPFTTHLNALGQKMYLRIADELYLKRLIVGGYEKVYEIAKDFRNEGVDRTHNPEFTMIEWYEAYADYQRVMDVTEGLFKHLANTINGNTKMKIDEMEIDLSGKWPRISMAEIMKDKLQIDVEKATLNDLITYCQKEKIELLGKESKGQLIFLIFEHKIPKLLIQPTWIIDYPIEVSPLSKEHRSKPGWVERFEGYIGGREICDGWSELTDPLIQRTRFTEDIKAIRKDKEEAQQVDEDFLTAIEYGMPPTGGIGIGIDRLTMFFTNTWAIKEVILFPTLRREEKLDTTKTIYPDLTDGKILSIDSEVKERFPSVCVGVAIIKGVDIKKTDVNLQNEINDLLQSFAELTTESIGKIPAILSYRKLYKEMGIDWHSRRPSPEALLRRVSLKKGLYNVNTCVDAYNLVVMKYQVSAGAFDLDQISLPTVLRFPKPGEQTELLGDDKPYIYSEKELGYFDQKGGYNVDFNYRDAKRTAVTEKTKNILINVDGIHDINRSMLERTLKEVVEIITKYCGGKVELVGVVK